MKLLTAVAVGLLWVGVARPGSGDDPKVAAARAGVR